MNTFPFEYELPSHLIAQHPTDHRDSSRLLVVRRDNASLAHHVFRDLPDLLDLGDLLVLNDTKVLPARLLGRRSRTGGKWEGLYLGVDSEGRWELLCQTRGTLQAGESIEVEPGQLRLQLVERTALGNWLVRPETTESTLAALERHGHVPLPHYIRKGEEDSSDRERYQTVFAAQPGAVAAPTAGLHFTPDLFHRLRSRGIAWSFVTLHVGPGTFRPVETVDITQHRMHEEWCDLPGVTIEAIRSCKLRGRRVVAIGTTTVRVLETVARSEQLRPWTGRTDLFIYPPFRFRAVDALVTNFHLPRSTLLLLVSAFGGSDLLRRAYEEAIFENYRFFSYGDAMLIL
jgi:S-adenosylmethionine:tRNA ribosyltransferase-isomerase